VEQIFRGSELAVVLHGEVSELETALPDERAQLVRLCAHLSGDADAAEDLAQETLLEAWRNAHKLQDPAGRGRWLAAIARNVCLRRSRSRGRELSRLAHPWQDDPAQPSILDGVADAGADLELELERGELARLLDRAMALLPADTRAVLVERLIHESPQAEAAARLGLREGVVAVRLHRGRLALRRLLATELGAEAREYGLTSERDTLGETRICCPLCGQRRLVGRLDSRTGELLTRCPD
jgi:RNA polymerase sigma-70 factor (ECF subfamily)